MNWFDSDKNGRSGGGSRKPRSGGNNSSNYWDKDDNSPSSGRPGGNKGQDKHGNTIDFQEFARKMSSQFGGGGGNGGGDRPLKESIGKRGIIVGLVVLFLGWLSTGIYTVQPDQQGIVLRFGKYVRTAGPGLHMHVPFPVETVMLPRVTQINTVNVGFRNSESFGLSSANTKVVDIPEESLILTGDENIVDVDFSVLWFVSSAPDYLFNIKNPDLFIKAVSESAMREIIGTRNIQSILTEGRSSVQEDARQLIQSVLDGFKSGVTITKVQLEKVDPPEAVIDAFRDVQAARADKQRLQNEADSYANRVIPEARGRAAELLQQAEGYREQVIAEAKGQASRFEQLYSEYRKSPDVTRYRIYMETMEKVLGGTNKVLLDDRGGNGSGGGSVIPYLPLSQLAPNAKKQDSVNQGGNTQ